MSVLRFFALILIFVSVSIAWMLLGASMQYRTDALDESLSGEMDSLWGPQMLAQGAPYIAPTGDSTRDRSDTATPAASTISADISHQHRYKGLLWYSTFTLTFDAEYTMPPPVDDAEDRYFHFPLPRGVTSYDDLQIHVDQAPVPVSEGDIQAGWLVVPVPEEGQPVVTIRYVTRGRDAWVYTPGRPPRGTQYDPDRAVTTSPALARLRDFTMTVTTDFADIDYPKGTRSPSRKAEPTDDGMVATWQYAGALTNQAMGVAMPKRQNAGPIVARMSLFAPLSLLLFFAVVFAVVILKKVTLHPMHYLFVAMGFFAFHVLMAYLVDIMDIHAAFWTCAAVSVLLVVSYMRLVAGVRFGIFFIGAAQLVYLVGFSYAFFWVGRTGLTVAIVAVITLFILMQATGRMNWSEAFRRRNGAPPPIPPVEIL